LKSDPIPGAPDSLSRVQHVRAWQFARALASGDAMARCGKVGGKVPVTGDLRALFFSARAG
jgi:hypothetical protein